jgi:hypothetical protein
MMSNNELIEHASKKPCNMSMIINHLLRINIPGHCVCGGEVNQLNGVRRQFAALRYHLLNKTIFLSKFTNIISNRR